jgi:hypothetical protein
MGRNFGLIAEQFVVHVPEGIVPDSSLFQNINQFGPDDLSS